MLNMRIFPQTVVFHGWKLALATGHSSTRTTSNKHSSLPACSVFRPKRTKFTAYCVFLVFEYCICVFVAVFVYVSILRDKRRSSSKTLFLTRRLLRSKRAWSVAAFLCFFFALLCLSSFFQNHGHWTRSNKHCCLFSVWAKFCNFGNKETGQKYRITGEKWQIQIYIWVCTAHVKWSLHFVLVGALWPLWTKFLHIF